MANPANFPSPTHLPKQPLSSAGVHLQSNLSLVQHHIYGHESQPQQILKSLRMPATSLQSSATAQYVVLRDVTNVKTTVPVSVSQQQKSPAQYVVLKDVTNVKTPVPATRLSQQTSPAPYVVLKDVTNWKTVPTRVSHQISDEVTPYHEHPPPLPKGSIQGINIKTTVATRVPQQIPCHEYPLPLPKSSIQGINFPTALPSQKKSLSLRKVPNTQKSLSLVKSKITSKSILRPAGHLPLETEATIIDCQPVSESRESRIIDDNSVGLTLAHTPQTAINTECLTLDYESEVDRLKTILEHMLPSNYSHHIVSVNPLQPYHKSSKYDQRDMFVSEVRTSLKTKMEALQWIEDFKSASSTDWRVRLTFQENTRCLIYKKVFRCHHNTLAQYRPNTKSGLLDV